VEAAAVARVVLEAGVVLEAAAVVEAVAGNDGGTASWRPPRPVRSPAQAP
jgi:hypothetical protein